jgi:hypothetical protein
VTRADQRALQDDMAGRALVDALSVYVTAEELDPLSRAIVDEFFSADETGQLRGEILRCKKRSHIMRELSRLLGWKYYNARELRKLRKLGV